MNASGMRVDVRQVILHGGDGIDADEKDLPGITAGYLQLLGLASSIHREGLIEPIVTVKRGRGWLIIAGERRWLAHHLLHEVIGEHETVLAIEKKQASVWEQAAENGARNPLNAIGTARQLALLIMDLHDGQDGVKFYPYDDLVLPGECDRKFYAQAKNHNIPRGMGQRIMDVMGFASKRVTSDYRKLWEIPDELWIQADVEDWTKNRILEELDEIEGTNRTGSNTPEMPSNQGSVTDSVTDKPRNMPSTPSGGVSAGQPLSEWYDEPTSPERGSAMDPYRKYDKPPAPAERDIAADKVPSAGVNRDARTALHRHPGWQFLRLLRNDMPHRSAIRETVNSLEKLIDEEIDNMRSAGPEVLEAHLQKQYERIAEWLAERLDQVDAFFNDLLGDGGGA